MGIFGDCMGSLCYSTAPNSRFITNGWLDRWEAGSMLASGDDVSSIITIGQTLDLYLESYSIRNFSVEVFGPPVVKTTPFTSVHVATLEWMPFFCGWVGEWFEHFDSPSYPQTTIVELYPYWDSDDEELKLTGKLWGDDWEQVHWLRITGDSTSFRIQNRSGKFFAQSPITCEGWWDDCDGIPTWMRTLPETYIFDYGDSPTCSCVGGYSGPIGDNPYTLLPCNQSQGCSGDIYTACQNVGFYEQTGNAADINYNLPENCVRTVFMRPDLAEARVEWDIPDYGGQAQAFWSWRDIVAGEYVEMAGAFYCPWGDSTLKPMAVQSSQNNLYPASCFTPTDATMSVGNWGTTPVINAGGW